MATFKCKMCGGDLDVTDGMTVCECEYCGSKQTVPMADNEKKINLFSRANRLRSVGEFDKAFGVYESIISEFPEEAEAYWGLILCKYGIEYVDDPKTGKKIPTCHRSSFDSVMEDFDFEMVMEYSDVVSRAIYREEAKIIEQLRVGIIDVSSKEEPYDIFICYKEDGENGQRTIDSVIAQDVYNALTEKGYRVFFARISLEDKLGQEYEPYIFAALNSARIMLAFGTDYEYYNAVWVKNEWSRFLNLIEKGEKKTLIPCYKDIDAYDMPTEFKRLQAQDMGKVGAIQDLVRGIEKIMPLNINRTATNVDAVVANGTVDSLLGRVEIFLADKKWVKADEYCEKVLDIEPKNPNAYVGKLLALCHVTKIEEIEEYLNSDITENENYIRAIQFSDKDLKNQLEDVGVRQKQLFEKKQYADNIYQEAITLFEKARNEEDYLDIISLLEQISGFKDVDDKLKICHTRINEVKEKNVQISHLAVIRNQLKTVKGIISCTQDGPLGLRIDGTILENKSSEFQYIPNFWKVVSIDANSDTVIGLKTDGTVLTSCRLPLMKVAIDNPYRVIDLDTKSVSEKTKAWHDIVAVSAGDTHFVGLKSDGTVVAAGGDIIGECDVSDWTDIVAIAAGCLYTVGLKADGTVVAVGLNDCGQCDVSDWTDIVEVSVYDGITVGLQKDGTVVVTGGYKESECDVSDWNNIVAVSSGVGHIVGICDDGRVIATGLNFHGECDVSDWHDIVAISAGLNHTVGLKSNGTMVATGENNDGQCDVADWKLFNSIDTLEEERKIAAENEQKESVRLEQERQEHIRNLIQERESLMNELANIKGIFSGKRRKEINNRLDDIEIELGNG
jgi:tetratricopeptide (TPR) repeat protein